jgi:hypothetical protein
VPITELPTGGLGSAISPQEWAQFVLTHLTQQSVVLSSGATRVDTALRQVHIPRVTADAGFESPRRLWVFGPCPRGWQRRLQR